MDETDFSSSASISKFSGSGNRLNFLLIKSFRTSSASAIRVLFCVPELLALELKLKDIGEYLAVRSCSVCLGAFSRICYGSEIVGCINNIG